MSRHSRSSSSAIASPMTSPPSNDQREVEQRKARKRIQNRMAQRLYRQRQRQRIEDLRAKLDTQTHETHSDMLTPPESVGHGMRQSTKDLGFNGFLTAPAAEPQDPFSTIFDRAPVDYNHSPMPSRCSPLLSYHNSGNASSNDAAYTQSSSNGVAPVPWTGYMGPVEQDMWTTSLDPDLNLFDDNSMSSGTLALEPQTTSPELSSRCMTTAQPVPTAAFHVQPHQNTCPPQEAQAQSRRESTEGWPAAGTMSHTQQDHIPQTNIADACVLSTSGVSMLQDLLTTATEAQRLLCTPVTCEQVLDQGQEFCEQGQNIHNTFTPRIGPSSVNSADALQTLLPDVHCMTSDQTPEASGRRLPRLVSTVRHALDEWRKWQEDGFPLD